MATLRRGSFATGHLAWGQPTTIALGPLVPSAPVPPEPPVMKLPRPVYDTCKRYADRFPPPQIRPGESPSSHEQRCREWTVRMAQQVVFEHGPSYGAKKASPTRPISKDSLAHKDGSEQDAWDMLHAAGSGHPTFVTYPPQAHDIDGQVFVSVPPVNHLGSPEPPEPPEPPPTPIPPTPIPPTPCPPCTCNGPATYAESLHYQTVVDRIRMRYRTVHGREPADSDIGHNLYRWYREDRWPSLEAILDDIK